MRDASPVDGRHVDADLLLFAVGLEFGAFPTAQRSIQDYEVMHRLHKGQIEEMATRDVLTQNRVVNPLVGLAASRELTRLSSSPSVVATQPPIINGVVYPRTGSTAVNASFCNAPHQHLAKVHEETSITMASELLHQHIQTLVADYAQWQTLIADALVWELPYAPAIGHPVRLSGRKEVVRHVTWFLGAVNQFRFLDLQVYACADPDTAVAEVQAEARIKTTGRLYRQAYVLFLRAAGGKTACLRGYFDPVRAAQALDTPILELGS